MKLSRLYSNDDDLFPPIDFRRGFNVVFARVKDPTNRDQDSHNLGKTFLITVIDFVLLAGVDQHHPFKEHEEQFRNFEFYLEIETVYGTYVTIRRRVTGRKPVDIHTHPDPKQDLRNLQRNAWTYADLAFNRGAELLNELLDLTALQPYSFRKGLGYVLRRQSDYQEIFRISKFGFGRDRDWKPFVTHLLGFNQEVIERKYALDQRIEELQKDQRRIELEAGSESAQYDEVRGRIEIQSAAVERLRRELETFSFKDLEAEISQTTVREIESEIAAMNERRYTIDYELQELEKALNSKLEFDLERIKDVFEEVELVFPESLARSYEDLVRFNERLSSSRNERLRELRSRLISERAELERVLQLRDRDRQSALALLHERETLEKYRVLQRRLIARERELAELRGRLEALDKATEVGRKVEELREERNRASQAIRDMIHGENATYSAIRRFFSEFVESVLSVPALLSVQQNSEGNLDFRVRTLDPSTTERETSEGRGTSYKKLLCASFDLALVRAYSDRRFYRFVYHDGILEGLDNRKKVNLLDSIRAACSENGIQYILTVIDSDVPRDERDEKLLFTPAEIVRELHDRGDEGRLFRMPSF